MNNDRTGKLNLILGCMWSGKTSELISRYNRYVLGGKKCIMIKYKKDTRYSTENKVVTHDGITIECISCKYLYQIDNEIANYDVICVDEIQFFQDGYIFCDKWANDGKLVEACGLNGTSSRTTFDVVSKILPQVDNIKFCKAICKNTGKPAIYSGRISNDVGDIVIGGDDKYVAWDRKSYMDAHKEKDLENKFNDFVKFLGDKKKITSIVSTPNYNQKNINFIQHVKLAYI